MKIITKFIVILFMITISTVAAKENDMIEKEGFINVSGGKVWYKTISSEKTKNKIPLLILHGGPGVPHDYLDVFKAIAKERPVIFYDQLGCGHSTISNPDKNLWNLKRFLSELEILVDHLHLDKFNLLGHSWGGALATEYALKHPDKINSLILASPLLSTNVWIKDARQLITQLPPDVQMAIHKNEQQDTTDSVEYKNAMNVYYHHFICRMKHWPEKLIYSLDHINVDIYKTMWGVSEFTVTGNLKNFDRINDMKKLNMPMLLTGGRFDEATPETLEKVAAQLSQGKLIIYENSAHFAFLEEEKKYLNDLRNFLDAAEK